MRVTGEKRWEFDFGDGDDDIGQAVWLDMIALGIELKLSISSW